jgi:transposase
MAFFEALSSCLIGMEACATAHYWARELTKCHSACNFDPLSWGIGVQN